MACPRRTAFMGLYFTISATVTRAFCFSSLLGKSNGMCFPVGKQLTSFSGDSCFKAGQCISQRCHSNQKIHCMTPCDTQTQNTCASTMKEKHMILCGWWIADKYCSCSVKSLIYHCGLFEKTVGVHCESVVTLMLSCYSSSLNCCFQCWFVMVFFLSSTHRIWPVRCSWWRRWVTWQHINFFMFFFFFTGPHR